MVQSDWNAMYHPALHDVAQWYSLLSPIPSIGETFVWLVRLTGQHSDASHYCEP